MHDMSMYVCTPHVTSHAHHVCTPHVTSRVTSHAHTHTHLCFHKSARSSSLRGLLCTCVSIRAPASLTRRCSQGLCAWSGMRTCATRRRASTASGGLRASVPCRITCCSGSQRRTTCLQRLTTHSREHLVNKLIVLGCCGSAFCACRCGSACCRR